ncbi:MAG TPA: cbb3-type cytochrome c oxidase subunit I, partial [Candidatus Limnocylindrales bacterium]
MTAVAAGAVPAVRRPSVISGFFPILRGLVFAVIGFLIGAAVAAGIRMASGAEAWAPTQTSANGTIPSTEQIVTLGFIFAVPAWLMGVGFLETAVRPFLGYKPKPVVDDWRRYLTVCEDHKVIGLQYLATFVVVLLVAGVGAMLMRVQLMQPANTFLTPDLYNRIMSFHGIAMVSVAVASVMGSFGNYFVPIMIGARDMAFPRLNALSYWLIPVVIVSLFLSQLLGGWDSGWTSYPPLSVKNAAGQVVFNLA